VSGKGGVGKTVVSQAIARALAESGRRTLWVTFEDPLRPQGETQQIDPNLWHLNCEAGRAFEEYMRLKIPVSRLATLFVENRLMRYLAKAAPGMHELVLLGKVWFERPRYDHVVVDMLSTGYGIAMFQSTRNFAHLFKGGPIQRDAEAMLETFADPALTGQLIVSLPEEMPLRESLELGEILTQLFPRNAPAYLVNRSYPEPRGGTDSVPERPDEWKNPLAESARDYAIKRFLLEKFNLRLWRDESIPIETLPYLPPVEQAGGSMSDRVIRALSEKLATEGFV
jgi:anion-transporting  ArsA/GET3 family ATPase